jgi:hypothetical protein
MAAHAVAPINSGANVFSVFMTLAPLGKLPLAECAWW